MDKIFIKNKETGKVLYILDGDKIYEVMNDGKRKRRKDLEIDRIKHEPSDLRKNLK